MLKKDRHFLAFTNPTDVAALPQALDVSREVLSNARPENCPSGVCLSGGGMGFGKVNAY